MIDLAKSVVTGQTQEEKLIGGNLNIEDFLEKKPDAEKPEVVKSPSLMIMACNMLEVLRMREELVQRIHETDLLSIAYKEQLKQVNKDSFKLILADPLAFDTTSIMKENMNMIDYNDGSKIEFDLPFREFDGTLKASLDFKSESCIKALMTTLGVEELRAVLHYQIMQQQLLQVAVMLNQQLIDGSQKGLYELEFMAKKRAFTVPNSIININQMLSKGLDGYNLDMFNKEKAKLKQILQRESGDYIYSIASKKQKQRGIISKRYQNVLSKVITLTSKPEVKLRMLRSYRIKLLHNYCKDVLREVYQDSLKIQLLEICSDLRTRSQLLPKDTNLFHLGQGEIQETMSYAILAGSNFYKNSQKYNIGMILNNRFETLFYIPSSDEVMQTNNSMDEKELQQQSIAQFAEQISEQSVDQSIKDLVRQPLKRIGFKSEEGQKYQLRKVQIGEAYSYTTQSFKVLSYMTLVQRIFFLEYIMGRNNSPSIDILEMEDRILNGRPYWDSKKDAMLLTETDESKHYGASERVISKIISQKKAKIDLAEDLKNIADRLFLMNEWSKRFTIENLKIDTMIELLNLKHQQCFSHFLYGLETLLDTYLDKKNEEVFNKVRQVKFALIKRHVGFKMLGNGFSCNQSCVNGRHIDLSGQVLRDHSDWEKSYQSVIDEESLMPTQIDVVLKQYGAGSFLDDKGLALYLMPYVRNYAGLENSFFNVTDADRQYAYTNFYQAEEGYKEYLSISKQIPDEKNADQEQVLLAKIEMLTLKNEAKHLQNVLLSWNASAFLPSDILEYEKLFKGLKEQVMMKILQERESLNEQANKQKIVNEFRKQSELGNKVSKDIVLETLGMGMKEQQFNIKVNERKAEVNVYKRELDIRIIKQGIQMIKTEHSSLLAAFEQAGTEKEIQAFVHPQQQFASTLYQQVDKNSHLDIVNKLSFVQSFLTRLRNRCTEVETLTSGPGIVFSVFKFVFNSYQMKDFNECLQIFCRGLLKYGEQELRTRVETQFLKEYQYQHLLYLKDQSTLYYKNKCEQFLTDIDKLINAKLTQKGNQIIYELDVANRELRMLKDNFYLMERLLRLEIKNEYEKTIQEKENTIQKFKESFGVYKAELNNEIKEEVAKEILSLDKKVKLIVDKRETNLNSSQRGVTQQLGSQIGKTNVRQNALGASNEYLSQNYNSGASTTNYYDVESRREILSLHKFIRKYKILTQMKEVITQEKHERDLHNQRQQLTSNACLWEQLAEAEKREQIMRQELYYTQQNLAQYEKLIEKLQTQLENLQNQKLRLQQYKNSKSKRIEELESKMRQVEIIENIDLNKVLEELRQRDKKVTQLEAVDRNISQKIEVVNKINNKRLSGVEKKYQKEKDLKEQAFGKLESLRLEMRALEGKDYTSELWKDKCKELFEICKELQKENDGLKMTMGQQSSQLQGLQLQANQYQGGRLSQNHPFSPFSTTKDKQGFSLNSLDQTTKPSTAAAKFSQQSRLMSRGGGLPGSHHGHILHSNVINEQTLTSGLSLPEIAQQETDGTIEHKSDLMKTAFQTSSNFMIGKQKERMQSLGTSAGMHDAVASSQSDQRYQNYALLGRGAQNNMITSNDPNDILNTMLSDAQSVAFKHGGIALSQPSVSSMSKSQSRMNGSQLGPSHNKLLNSQHTLQQSTKFKSKQKRLKMGDGKEDAIQKGINKNAAISRQMQQNLTTGFAGLQIINGNNGTAQSSGSGILGQIGGQRAQMNLIGNSNNLNQFT